MKKTVRIISFVLVIAIFAVTSIFFVACGNKNEPNTELLATVEGGQIKGAYVDDTKEIISFKGIPYAAPPTGENRWRRPQPVVKWDGVKDCTQFGNSAMQPAQERQEGTKDTDEFIISNKVYSEDCLNLNVWTKNDETKNKPVLVYVHGGAFVAGGSSCEVYDGRNIAAQDVVFVSINFRLGIFAWFANDELIAEDEEGSSGNYGLMDIIKALEWVRDNIAAFGGDGSNITLMGQSSGSSMVQHVLASPKAQGLINNLVASSYNNMTPVFPMSTVANRAKALKTVGTLKELRAKSAEELSQMYQSNLALVLSAVSVCNDGAYIDYNKMEEAIELGRGKNVNIIEGMVWDNDSNNGNNDSQFAGTKPAEITTGERLMYNLNLLSAARTKYEATGKTYFYNWAYPMSGPDKDKFGAFHTCDIPYFFNYLTPLRADYWTDTDIAMAKTASSYLVNFCKTGNPNGEQLVEWKANNGDYSYMRIDNPCEMKTINLSESID